MQMLASVLAGAVVWAAGAQTLSPENALRETFADQASALEGRVRTHGAGAFLDALPHLPGVGEGRSIRYDRSTGEAMTNADFDALADDDPSRDRFNVLPVDDTLYYTRLFGTPALYTRALDLASVHGVPTFDDARILDFGFGQVGHLRALASTGAHCVGVEVNPLLEAMYSEQGDTGLIDRHDGAEPGPPGTLRLVYGSWPGDEGVRAKVDGRYDLIISKNVLKRGYIHPEREADPSQLIDLGVDDDVFIRALHDALVPGGLVVIYNFSPAQAPDDEPYIPWADGRCPFGQEQWTSAGFEVLAHDVNDTEEAIEHFVAVGAGDREGLEGNLFGMYTVVRKPVD
ncbi:MAG: hypothetical protein Tsb0013_07050 [Phycisphaerales bacterium]